MDRAQHALLEQIDAPDTGSRLAVRFARDDGEVREAQQLRWRVFSGELHANLPSGEHGIDRDIFDRYCRHLLVRDERAGRVVGTYRVLAPDAARRIGCYYSEEAFDLTRLRTIRTSLVEVGRSCIDPAYRRGAVIAMLWAGLLRYMIALRYTYLAGSASMSLSKGGVSAVYDELRLRNMAPVEFLVRPRNRLPEDHPGMEPSGAEAPPLIKAYLRAGAWVCGEPAWDEDFNTADFFMLLPISRLNPRYARHFLGDVRAA